MRKRGLGTVLVAFGTTLAVILFNSETQLAGGFWWWAFRRLAQLANDESQPWLSLLAWNVVRDLLRGFIGLLLSGVSVTCVAIVVAVVARAVAAARVRAGKPDPLERLRGRPKLVLALTLMPLAALAFPFAVDLVSKVREMHAWGSVAAWLAACTGDLVAWGLLGAGAYAAGRAVVRGVLAPLETGEPLAPKEPGEIVFSAVAVTRRTRGAVAALAAASVAMVAWALLAPSQPAFPWALAAYIAAAMSAPFALRRASRIAVGLDGIWVRDASHALFFAYRDLEGAVPSGADLELVAHGGDTVLRLQMHGDDAARRDEVLARIREAIARSRTGNTRGAEMLVQAMPTAHIVAGAGGDARYRMPAVSREQLWDLVESPATDASTRTLAAEALAMRIDDADRARLRIAAEQCAEPRVRVTLAALAEEDTAPLDAYAPEGAPTWVTGSSGEPRRR